METVTICFSTDEISSLVLHDNVVPDVLLLQAWYVSETSRTIKGAVRHTKQRVTDNKVKPDKLYDVKIFLKERRKVKHMQQYTYELIYYDGPVVRARMQSTFVQEERDED